MFTVGLKNDGTVVTNGETYQGNIKVAEKWTNIVEIDAGNHSIVGLKDDGTVEDTLNNVSSWKDIIQVSAGNNHTVALKKDGTVIASGENNYGELNIENWKDIIQVSAGLGVTIGLKSDGTVLAVGNNRYGQCNVEEWRDIVKVEVTDEHVVGLKNDGTLVSVGNNYYGQCNVNEFKDIIDIKVGSTHTVGLKSDGSVLAVGGIEDIGAANVYNWNDIVSIAAGDHHTVGLTKDGELVSTGDNRSGQGSFFINKNNIINSTKKIYKINEPINILANSNDFYNLYGTDIEINEELYSLEKDEEQYFLNYIPTKSGNIDVRLPKALDLYGNFYSKKSLLKVIPLKEIIANKTKGSSGEIIIITVIFTESVKSDFIMDLSGDINVRNVKFSEVSGTNSTKFIATYKIPYVTCSSNVDINIKNLTDNNGVFYHCYTEENVFSIISSSKPVINGMDDISIFIGDDFDPMSGVRALDYEGVDITSNIIVKGNIDTNNIGIYELIYLVTDSYGNQTNMRRIITVDYAKEDVNRDKKIDTLDLALVGINYNISSIDLDMSIDINKDGIVDIFDLVLVSKKLRI